MQCHISCCSAIPAGYFAAWHGSTFLQQQHSTLESSPMLSLIVCGILTQMAVIFSHFRCMFSTSSITGNTFKARLGQVHAGLNLIPLENVYSGEKPTEESTSTAVSHVAP